MRYTGPTEDDRPVTADGRVWEPDQPGLEEECDTGCGRWAVWFSIDGQRQVCEECLGKLV